MVYFIKCGQFFHKLFSRSRRGLVNESVKKDLLKGSNIQPNILKETVISPVRDTIKVDLMSSPEFLITEMKSGRCTVDSFSEIQKDMIITHLREEISKEKLVVSNAKNKILYGKLINAKDREAILNRVSSSNKDSFIEYLKCQIFENKRKLVDIKV